MDTSSQTRLSLSLLIALAVVPVPGCSDRPAASPHRTSTAETPPLRAPTIAEAVEAARDGDTIVLPAGTYSGGLALPPGVSLRGAGYGRTVLDARKAQVGLTVRGGKKAEISDLTIRGALKTNLLVERAERVLIRRVRTTGSLNGISFADVVGGRIENAVCDSNRYGIIVSAGRDNVVVNSTLARNASLGLSLPSGERPVAFNNCIAESATAVYLGEGVKSPRLDHNLYFSMFVGKLAGQMGRKSIGPWRTLSGQDARSVQLPVRFRDPDHGDLRPSAPLDWALDRAATTDWGAETFADIKAPERDIDGRERQGAPDVGAFEVAFTPPRSPDGTFTVQKDDGLKSAGLFAPGGHEIAYLFHNLPLPAGQYPFWFPARDFEGRPIPDGTYELKTVASALSWEYLNWVGDTGPAAPPSHTAAVDPRLVAFDEAGHLILGTGWSEDATNLRGYDVASGRCLWSFGGHADLHGLTLGGDGSIYALKPSGTQGLISRVDPATGKVVQWGNRKSGTFLFDAGASATGLAELGGRLYVTDAPSGSIRLLTIEPPSLAGAVAIPSPESPAADSATQHLWVISQGRTVLALDPAGKVKARVAPVEEPAALAARDGRLAVASRKTGKVHLFDAHDPEHLKPLRTVGRGDGPYGTYRPDRFHFQSSPTEPGSHVGLALGPKGELAVAEENRLLVFDAKGDRLWSTFGEFGDFTALSLADPRRILDAQGRKSIRLDEETARWAPEAFWNVPWRGDCLGFFADGDKTFGAFLFKASGRPDADLLVARVEGTTLRPVLRLSRDPSASRGAYSFRKDSNADGRIDDRDTPHPLLAPKGTHPLRGGEMFRPNFCFLQPNGDILALALNPETWGVIWRRTGLDADGVPIYRLADCRAIVRHKDELISAYTHKPEPGGVLVAGALDERGGLTAVVNTPSAPGGTGLFNNAGTDVVQLDPDGHRRWLHPLSVHKGIEGLGTVGPVTVVGVGTTCEIIALNRDGLGLGSFGFLPELRYDGYYLDHPQAVRLYQGHDRKTYLLVADNVNGRQHWWRLNGEGTIAASTRPVNLSPQTARTLAALPDTVSSQEPRPATPVVRVTRLRRELPIDGDLAKWRDAGVLPQIIVTPETAAGAIDGPRDVSAIVRMAYDAEALYLQFLTFDDHPEYYQPVLRHHQQDGIEFCINGFMKGFKFDVTQTADAGTIIIRQRFFEKSFDLLIPPAQAPRIVKVLPDATDVPERSLIETIYGIDLARSPVVVTEFKLPIDANTYKGDPGALFPLKPGQSFRFGMLINDNDEPGTDIQNYLVWPATYGNFNPVDDSAIAVLD